MLDSRLAPAEREDGTPMGVPIYVYVREIYIVVLYIHVYVYIYIYICITWRRGLSRAAVPQAPRRARHGRRAPARAVRGDSGGVA